MLRADSKWTLLVTQPATKKSICLWVWLGSAGKSAFGQLCRRERARELSIICKKKTSKDHRLDPQWGSRRVGLPCACEPTARGVRSEGCPCCLHQLWNAQRGCFERPAPRSVPNTAPDPPLPPGFGSPRARGGTRSPPPARVPVPWEYRVQKAGRNASRGSGRKAGSSSQQSAE